MEFYDIFWYENDLTKFEKDSFLINSAKFANLEMKKIGFIVDNLPY